MSQSSEKTHLECAVHCTPSPWTRRPILFSHAISGRVWKVYTAHLPQRQLSMATRALLGQFVASSRLSAETSSSTITSSIICEGFRPPDTPYILLVSYLDFFVFIPRCYRSWSCWAKVHCVPKNVHLFIFQITLSKINRFLQFWCVKSWENLTSIACTVAQWRI